MANLQDLFLNQARKERMNVSIYLTNGFQHKGVVKGFDNFVIMIENEGKQHLIYKIIHMYLCCWSFTLMLAKVKPLQQLCYVIPNTIILPMELFPVLRIRKVKIA